MRPGGHLHTVPLDLSSADHLEDPPQATGPREKNTASGRIQGGTRSEPSHGREPLIYELIGVIEHIGSHKEGHYIAFTRGKEAWNLCDDNNISPVALHDVLKRQAYMLLYRAKTTGKRRRADGTTGNADIGPEQHARQHTSGPKERPPHRQKGPRISGEAAMVVCGGGEDPGTPSPGHGAGTGRPAERSKLQPVGRQPIPQGG